MADNNKVKAITADGKELSALAPERGLAGCYEVFNRWESVYGTLKEAWFEDRYNKIYFEKQWKSVRSVAINPS